MALCVVNGVVCGEVIRAMLRISEVTTFANATRTLAISAAEISRALSSGFAISTDVSTDYIFSFVAYCLGLYVLVLDKQ